MKILLPFFLCFQTFWTFGQTCSNNFIECDSTFTLALGPSDDASSSLISLPFNFCFYDTIKTDLYINNNGMLTFNSAFSTYTPSSIPFVGKDMIAPFWADVDTRSGNGTVKYKISPTSLIVCYDSVGYYSMHGDKRNSFQVILTNGTDSLVPNGNIAFRFKDMQWASGDASAGVNGFGGAPANVGVNKANGLAYISLGRFSENSAVYDGHLGAVDGVNWLDNKSFNFNICANNSNEPLLVGPNPCDTIQVCSSNDTIEIPFQYTCFDTSLTTTISLLSSGTINAQLSTNTAVDSTIINLLLIGNSATSGTYPISLMAINNKVIPDTTYSSFYVYIDSTNSGVQLLSNFSFNPPSHCAPVTTLFTASQIDPSISYYWDFGVNSVTSDTSNLQSPSFTYTQAGTYSVKLVQNSTAFCGSPIDSIIQIINIGADSIGTTTFLSTCVGDTLTIPANSADSLFWSPNSTLNVMPNFNGLVFPSVPTQYFLTSITGGCEKTDTFFVDISTDPTLNMSFTFDPTSGCAPVSVTTYPTLISGYLTYHWDFGDPYSASDTNSQYSGNHYYTYPGVYPIELASSYMGICGMVYDTVVHYITIEMLQPGTGTTNSICAGDSILLASSNADSYYWYPNNFMTSQTDSTTTVFPSSTLNYFLYTITNGCTRTDTFTVIVNEPPIVNFTPLTDSIVCENNIDIALFGSPSGGIFSGSSAITGNIFSPSQAGPGTYTIYYQFTDINSCVNSDHQSITVDNCASLSEMHSHRIKVYPNPTNDFVNISFENSATRTLEIRSSLGQIIASKTFEDDQIIIDLSKFSDGMYMIKLIENSEIVTNVRIVKN